MSKPTALPRPFSGENYSENKKRCRATEQSCVFCGEGTQVRAGTRYLHVIEGGARFAKRSDVLGKTYSENGDMGVYPVGPDCWQRHALLIRAEGLYTEESEFSDEG